MAIPTVGRPLHLDPRIIARAARAEFQSEPRTLRWWLAFLMGLIAIGAVGAVLSLPPGDKKLGTTPAFEWGLLIAGYVFFVVTTSGLCFVSSLGQVFGIERFKPVARRHAVLAMLFLLAGFGLIALDLHYPLRLLFGAVLSPSPASPMWWMGVLYAGYMAFLALEIWSMFTGHDRITHACCRLTLISAIAAPSTLGAVFGVLAARTFWYGSFTPLYFFLSALLSGVAVLGVIFYLVNRLALRGHEVVAESVLPALGKVLAIALGVALFFVAWQVIVGLYGRVPGEYEATMALLTGSLSPLFWIFKVGLGLVVPLAVLMLTRTREPFGIFVASCLAFGGIFVDRLIFVTVGQIVPVTTVSGTVSHGQVPYTPTLVEISIVLGAIGFVSLVYTLAERFLDLSAPAHRDSPHETRVARPAGETA